MAKKKVQIFNQLKGALEDALAYERGQPVHGLQVTEIPPQPKPLTPDQIRAIRLRLHLSQAVFARLLNASANTVESWEQGVRRPAGPTLKLLLIARKNPRVLLLV